MTLLERRDLAKQLGLEHFPDPDSNSICHVGGPGSRLPSRGDCIREFWAIIEKLSTPCDKRHDCPCYESGHDDGYAAGVGCDS